MQVDPYLLRWTHIYLSNRSQSVVVNGVQSNPLTVISGIPQGSVLGPLLFLAYIESVASSVHHSKVIMYADGIVLYRIIKNNSDFSLLQEDVTSIRYQQSPYSEFSVTYCSPGSHIQLFLLLTYTGECQPLTRVSHY